MLHRVRMMDSICFLIFKANRTKYNKTRFIKLELTSSRLISWPMAIVTRQGLNQINVALHIQTNKFHFQTTTYWVQYSVLLHTFTTTTKARQPVSGVTSIHTLYLIWMLCAFHIGLKFVCTYTYVYENEVKCVNNGIIMLIAAFVLAFGARCSRAVEKLMKRVCLCVCLCLHLSIFIIYQDMSA